MNRKLYSMLCDNFNKPKTEEQYELFEEVFKDEDALYLEKAFKKIIIEDKYMPSIARIKEVIEEVYKEPLTEKEKLKRWEKEGITPSCLSKEPTEENVSDEELEELMTEWDLMFGGK